MPEKSNGVRESYANKRNAPTLLVANVSTERLDYCGIIFYRTDMLGKRCTRFTIAPFLHRKNNLTSRYLFSPFLEMSKPRKLPHYHVFKFPV